MIKIGTLHVCIWFTAVLSILGNVIALIFKIHHRILILKSRDVLMTNLCLSDMIMGVYLLIMAYKDVQTRGVYGKFHDEWLRSTLCEVAGCLSTYSCDVSTFTIFAIIVDRYYVFKHPFGRNEQRQRRICLVFVIVSCICSFALAVLSTIATNIIIWKRILWTLLCVHVSSLDETVAGVRSFAELHNKVKRKRKLAVARSLSAVVILSKREVPRGVRNSKVRRQDKFRTISDMICSLPVAILGECFILNQVFQSHNKTNELPSQYRSCLFI